MVTSMYGKYYPHFQPKKTNHGNLHENVSKENV